MTDPREPARAFCRAILTAFPGAKVTLHPLTRTTARANRLPLPPLPESKPQ